MTVLMVQRRRCWYDGAGRRCGVVVCGCGIWMMWDALGSMDILRSLILLRGSRGMVYVAWDSLYNLQICIIYVFKSLGSIESCFDSVVEGRRR